MAAPLPSLMSLQTDGTVTFNSNRKHVVPWKTRQEFQSVYDMLFNEDKSKQVKALQRIATWKTRVGPKLPVAIDSSSGLQQATLDYIQAQDSDAVAAREAQLKASASLAIVRFVNHVTEKGQTKVAAQPIHKLAEDFGIPEWIVRLRHDATHGTMPSLTVLMTGVDWALQYLKTEFWQKQLENDKDGEGASDEEPPKKTKKRKLKMSKIRETLYDFQKARFQELNEAKEEGGKTNIDVSNATSLHTLKSYLSADRLQLTRCLLQDGGLVSTPEQLAAFGVKVKDLLPHSPPTVSAEVCGFWRPLLRIIYMSGCLPLLMHAALFSVSAEANLRNYQLVAWLAYFLAQASDYKAVNITKNRRKRKRRRETDLMTRPLNIPKRTLLTACLQNITPYTIHLLKYLVDKKNMSPESFQKLTDLLNIPIVAQSCDLDTEHNSDEDDGSGSDSDTIYTVEDLKKQKLKVGKIKRESASVEDVQKSLDTNDVPWRLCTDIVDWSTVPFGVIPDQIIEEDDYEEDEDEDDEEEKEEAEIKEEAEERENEDSGNERKKVKRKRRCESEEDEDNNKSKASPKRCAYSPKEELL